MAQERTIIGSQNQFAAALIDLLREKSYEQITVTDLCRQAGHARQTFYKYFADKEALLEYLANSLYLMYLAHRDYREREGFFAFWYEMREVAQILIDRELMDRVARLSDETLSYLRPYLRGTGLEQDPEGADMLLEFINAGEVRLLKCWHRQGWKKTPSQMADVLESILTGSLGLEFRS